MGTTFEQEQATQETFLEEIKKNEELDLKQDYTWKVKPTWNQVETKCWSEFIFLVFTLFQRRIFKVTLFHFCCFAFNWLL